MFVSRLNFILPRTESLALSCRWNQMLYSEEVLLKWTDICLLRNALTFLQFRSTGSGWSRSRRRSCWRRTTPSPPPGARSPSGPPSPPSEQCRFVCLQINYIGNLLQMRIITLYIRWDLYFAAKREGCERAVHRGEPGHQGQAPAPAQQDDPVRTGQKECRVRKRSEGMFEDIGETNL